MNCHTPDTYRKLVRYMREKNIIHHTYQLKENRAFRIVTKHQHFSTDLQEIEQELNKEGHKVRNIINARSRMTKVPLNLFFVDSEPASNNKEIYKLAKLQNKTIWGKPPRKTKGIPQCMRCQQYGHTRSYCNKPYVCVKCGGSHSTQSCSIKFIRIALWNANGLLQQKNELGTFLQHNFIDIMLISETHFTDRSYFNIRKYLTYSTNHPDTRAGGETAILIKRAINLYELPNYILNHLQATVIKVKMTQYELTVAAVYCPWGSENPHEYGKMARHSPKVNVWCALMHDRVIGPFFFAEQTVTSVIYLDMLQNLAFPQIEALQPEITFQKDAPPHWSTIFGDALEKHFPGRWIGRGSQISWPPRSPDITPLDFFLWGYVKDIVYKTQVRDTDQLKTRLRDAITTVDVGMLSRTWQEIEYRLDILRATNGAHVQLYYVTIDTKLFEFISPTM
ncbi:hypothetical protein B7P43_G06576 [Cryptotermes secundus]|uniref:Pre-C2HC domain-containing protein n=1 Tax=Cryptotermes secundus TaxID=105785 RepID=A0A2J7QTW3_9NEOP|nr:hypothetical protein B7P43_G06576 [Cryptotermes secundus]